MKNKSVYAILLLLCAPLMNSCAEFNQNAAESVKIRTPKVDHCTYIGQVFSVDGTTSQMLSSDPATREHHFNILKRKAYDLGANTIVLESAGSRFKKQKGGLEHSMSAGAYRCPN